MSKKQLQKISIFGIAGIMLIAVLVVALKDVGLGSQLKAQDPAKYAMVMQRFEQAKGRLKKDSQDQDAIVRLGAVYEELGDYSSAINKYKKAIEIDKTVIIPWTNLASIYKKQEKYKDALNAYKQAIELFPKDTQSYNNLADLYINYNAGELDEILAIIEQGVKETADTSLKEKQDVLVKMKNK